MARQALIIVLLLTAAANAKQPPRTAGCPLQSESPAWLATGSTDAPRLPPLSQSCEIDPQQQSAPATSTGMPGQYYPDPMLQRDYMLMARPP
jgi:hypothetical protein